MSTWGMGPFDNDSAADFVGDFDEMGAADPRATLHGALTEVLHASGWIRGSVAQRALASAAIIAATLPSGYEYTRHAAEGDIPRQYEPEFIDLAVDAIHRIVNDGNDVRSDWEDRGMQSEWRTSMDRLLAALGFGVAPEMEALW